MAGFAPQIKSQEIIGIFHKREDAIECARAEMGLEDGEDPESGDESDLSRRTEEGWGGITKHRVWIERRIVN